MPKYYRFRALTPTRKTKRSRDKDKEKAHEISKPEATAERNWLDTLTLACSPAPAWYLRRTSWRQSPPLMRLPRQLSSTLRASFQLSNRPIFVFKVPATDFLKM